MKKKDGFLISFALSTTALLACGGATEMVEAIPSGPAEVSLQRKTQSVLYRDPSRHDFVLRERIDFVCRVTDCKKILLIDDKCIHIPIIPPRCPLCPVEDPRRAVELSVLTAIESAVLDPGLKSAVRALSLSGPPTRPIAPASLLDKAQLAAHLVADADLGAGLSDSAQDELATLLERWAVEAR